MVSISRVIPPIESANALPSVLANRESRRDVFEIASVLVLILIAVWMPPGRAQIALSVGATAYVIVMAVAGKWKASEMGLTRPLSGAGYTLAAGALACTAVVGCGALLRFGGPAHSVPLTRSWQYAIWAVEQEFILQSIFFLRLEGLVGPRRAVLAAAALFALAHIPSPVLTVLSFLGGVLFCELFRRCRNVYSLGTIHAALGLTIAAIFLDRWLHHMRVGIGYLMYHG
jgi:membrane protease YdiL (CAAX protease family)